MNMGDPLISTITKRKPVTASSDWSMRRVIDLMLREDVSTIMVVDGTGRMVGLVTESPLLVAAFDPLMGNDPVSLHMERQFVSLSAKATITEAAEAFLLHRVRHLPILENWVPVGIISRRDVLRYVVEHSSRGADALLT